MPRAILFDLDDTLYPEMEFVRSAMAAVAEAIEARFALPRAQALASLEAALERHGRGHTIDHALDDLACPRDPALLRELVATYRDHRPRLALHDDARRALDRLQKRGVGLGLVTDGDPAVQRAKARALGLERWMGYERYTWDDGAARQKPHPQAFQSALEGLRVGAGEAAYVGDNPSKDFIGARALGLATVRVLRGPYREIVPPPGHAADCELESLDDLESHLGMVGSDDPR